MVRKIVDSKDPLLRVKSKTVKIIDKKILDLIGDMKDTLDKQKDPEGVGLAAPQVGKNLQIFIVKFKNVSKVIINPEIIEISDRRGKSNADGKLMEGCLSLPHYYSLIKRPGRIKIKYLDQQGKENIEEFNEFLAQIVQHEIDHLNGVLFVDHVLKQDRPLYKYNGKTFEEVDL